MRFTYFTVRAGDTARVALTYRETAVDIPVLGTLSPGSTLTRLDGTGANLKDLLGSEGALAAWIEPEREPTKHLLRELSELAEPLDKLGLPIVLMIGNAEWTASFDPASYPKRRHAPFLYGIPVMLPCRASSRIQQPMKPVILICSSWTVRIKSVIRLPDIRLAPGRKPCRLRPRYYNPRRDRSEE